MKYVLAKDLPFAKAGEKIRIIDSRLGGQNITYEVDPENGLRIWTADVDILIEEGWIEEVKPREFEGYVLHDGKTFYMPPDIHDRYNAERYEKIKVREVLE